MYNIWDIVLLCDHSIAIVTWTEYIKRRGKEAKEYELDWIYWEFIKWVAMQEDNILCKIKIDHIDYSIADMKWKIVDVDIAGKKFKAQII